MTAVPRRRMKLAPEGRAFVLPLAGLTLLALWVGWWVPAGVGVVLTACVAFFFRDPERLIPQLPGAVVSPADGRVMDIVHEDAHTCRLGIFLSLLNVHVNRAPYGGVVGAVSYRPGKFLAAYRREASLVNEANSITIENQGQTFVVRQIAGVLARRIVCRVQAGDRLEKGQRYGLIRFGSRTEVTIPGAAEIRVRVGDMVKGGESILAILREPQDT